MTTVDFICPGCRGRLRLPGPVANGTLIECPRCLTTFGAATPAPELVPVLSAAAAAPAQPQLAAAARAEPPPASPSHPPMAEKPRAEAKETGETYAVIEDPSTAPLIDYAPDVGIADLRGPAQALVMKPSNRLLFICVLGAVGWLGLLIMILIPVAFPVPETSSGRVVLIGAPGSRARREAEAELAKQRGERTGKPSMFTLFGIDLAEIGRWPTEQVVLAFLVPVLGAIYSGFAAGGAIQMQNLWSRRWGKVGCVLALFPANSAGFGIVICLFFRALMSLFGIEDDVLYFPFLAILFLLWLLSLLSGLAALRVLNRPDVIRGFKFRGM